jgi:hypothetical protein
LPIRKPIILKEESGLNPERSYVRRIGAKQRGDASGAKNGLDWSALNLRCKAGWED